jgi:hypothetical protein
MPILDLESKKQVNAFIPIDLYEKLTQSGESQTVIITKGIELYFQAEKNAFNEQVIKAQLYEKDRKINDLVVFNENLMKLLQDNEEQHQARIEEMNLHFQTLSAQLHTKDIQIEKLTETMQVQEINIQTMIQENSRLNIKLLPENTEIKKPWWRFW